MVTENKTPRLSVFPSLASTEPKPTDWEQIMQAVKTLQMKSCCEEYRRLAALRATATGDEEASLKSRMSRIKRAVPAFVPSVELSGGRSKSCVRGYTGFVMVDIDHIPADKFSEAERIVKSDAHTLLAYVTLSGHGLRVIARMAERITEKNFQEAWRAVNEYYAAATGLPTDRQCSNATRMSCLSHDPDIVYNPDATPFSLPEKPKRSVAKGRPQNIDNAVRATRERVEREGISYIPGEHNRYVSRCIYWMNRFGVKEPRTLEWALAEFADYNAGNGNPVPAIVESIYRNHADEHGSRYPSGRSSAPKGRIPIEEIEKWLSGNYDIRRNVITQYVEIRKKDGNGEFVELTDVIENSLWCEMQRNGLNVDLLTLRSLLISDFVTEYSPLLHYLGSLRPWDGVTDHIGQFLRMVHCLSVSPEQFDIYVRRWLVAMIAAVLDDKVVNHEILVLLGKQGTYKTSFVNSILPPCLTRYYSVKTNSQRMTKDDVLALTENILINLEEIDSMTRSEVNQLKAMASMPYVCERPPYGRNKVRLPHIASFCATGNNLQFLTDNTGNRRWLVFEIDDIDNPRTTEINYEGIYAQLKHLYENGFKYWFDGSDIAALNEANKRFEAPNMERELIATHYRKPGQFDQCLYLSSSQIVARFSPQLRLSAVNVGKVMADLGFELVRTHNGRFWKVYEIPCGEVGHTVPSDDLTNNDEPF